MFNFNRKGDTEFYDLFLESAQFFYQGSLLMDEVMVDHRKADIKVKDRDSVRISFPEFYNYLENNN
jgi:hypothetical protein